MSHISVTDYHLSKKKDKTFWTVEIGVKNNVIIMAFQQLFNVYLFIYLWIIFWFLKDLHSEALSSTWSIEPNLLYPSSFLSFSFRLPRASLSDGPLARHQARPLTLDPQCCQSSTGAPNALSLPFLSLSREANQQIISYLRARPQDHTAIDY